MNGCRDIRTVKLLRSGHGSEILSFIEGLRGLISGIDLLCLGRSKASDVNIEGGSSYHSWPL